MDSSTTALAADPQASLKLALERVLQPLARLAVAQGLPYPVAEEMLKQAFVGAAREAQPPELAGKRDVSRIATTTGLNRREVTRLTQNTPRAAAHRPSPAIQLFTKWVSDHRLHLKARPGKPAALNRQGPAPSFEALAQSITRDVHPRSLLEELLRLELVELDKKTDQVRLLRAMFVPLGNRQHMLDFLGHNVADHLAAATDNVLSKREPHFEQALFCDELSASSLSKVRELIDAHWRSFMAFMVPQLTALIEADAAQPAQATQRLRIGLYTYHEALPEAAAHSPD